MDLDSEQQSVSAIWGFQVFVGPKNPNSIGFGGDFEVASFQDLFLRRSISGVHVQKYSAFYQSAISLTKRFVDTANNQTSEFIRQLSEATGAGKVVSIKFTVDGFVGDHTVANFTYGRVTGSIGVLDDSSPHQLSRSRKLLGGQDKVTVGDVSISLNNAYATIQGTMLHLDVSNSLPTISPGESVVVCLLSLITDSMARHRGCTLCLQGGHSSTLAPSAFQLSRLTAPESLLWLIQTSGLVQFPTRIRIGTGTLLES